LLEQRQRRPLRLAELETGNFGKNRNDLVGGVFRPGVVSGRNAVEATPSQRQTKGERAELAAGES